MYAAIAVFSMLKCKGLGKFVRSIYLELDFYNEVMKVRNSKFVLILVVCLLGQVQAKPGEKCKTDIPAGKDNAQKLSGTTHAVMAAVKRVPSSIDLGLEMDTCVRMEKSEGRAVIVGLAKQGVTLEDGVREVRCGSGRRRSLLRYGASKRSIEAISLVLKMLKVREKQTGNTNLLNEILNEQDSDGKTLLDHVEGFKSIAVGDAMKDLYQEIYDKFVEYGAKHSGTQLTSR